MIKDPGVKCQNSSNQRTPSSPRDAQVPSKVSSAEAPCSRKVKLSGATLACEWMRPGTDA